MNDILSQVTKLCKFLESSNPEADQVLPCVRKLSGALDSASRMESLHQLARNFCVQMVTIMNRESRFKSFPKIFLAATLLNPSRASRAKLLKEEESEAEIYLQNLANDLQVVNVQAPSNVDDVAQLFEDDAIPTTTANMTTNSFVRELARFRLTVDEKVSSFEFLKSNGNQYPSLKKVARSVLSVLPSPAVAERVFSRAGYLTLDRRNKLSTENLKTRLIITSPC